MLDVLIDPSYLSKVPCDAPRYCCQNKVIPNGIKFAKACAYQNHGLMMAKMIARMAQMKEVSVKSALQP